MELVLLTLAESMGWSSLAANTFGNTSLSDDGSACSCATTPVHVQVDRRLSGCILPSLTGALPCRTRRLRRAPGRHPLFHAPKPGLKLNKYILLPLCSEVHVSSQTPTRPLALRTCKTPPATSLTHLNSRTCPRARARRLEVELDPCPLVDDLLLELLN